MREANVIRLNGPTLSVASEVDDRTDGNRLEGGAVGAPPVRGQGSSRPIQ